jgi:hypothetical protein
MNHIKRLTSDNSELIAKAHQASTELTDLYVYLTSSKFYEDPTVQVSDVMRRTEQLRSILLQATQIGA